MKRFDAIRNLGSGHGSDSSASDLSARAQPDPCIRPDLRDGCRGARLEPNHHQLRRLIRAGRPADGRPEPNLQGRGAGSRLKRASSR
ncbi:hypothetical protein SAY86_015384 [Trapa natans]|uniref:Uncharacterized protein n=1 Tax=Trapa natans TaxID=22666 RepID=A0AAN7KHX2_TRANT|nr:hypothetical protein SAY86_015384 [Trapa natans]